MNTEKDSDYKDVFKTDFESNGKIVIPKNKTVKQIFQENFVPILIVFIAVLFLIVAIIVVAFLIVIGMTRIFLENLRKKHLKKLKKYKKTITLTKIARKKLFLKFKANMIINIDSVGFGFYSYY